MADDDLHEKTLTCVGCRDSFKWSRGDQVFARMNGWPPPRRCLKCRTFIKARLRERRASVDPLR